MSTGEWQDVLETALTGVFQGIKTVEVMQDGVLNDPELDHYTKAMKQMRLEELLIESDVDRMLIVKHVYDDVYAVVRYGDGAHAVDLSKLIRVVFSQKMGASPVNTKNYLSTRIIRMNIRRWEHSIAMIFGEHYASKLLANAMAGRDPGAMSMENMREVRAFLASAVGECLIFEPERVDK